MTKRTELNETLKTIKKMFSPKTEKSEDINLSKVFSKKYLQTEALRNYAMSPDKSLDEVNDKSEDSIDRKKYLATEEVADSVSTKKLTAVEMYAKNAITKLATKKNQKFQMTYSKKK